jgi:hypothetical protein
LPVDAGPIVKRSIFRARNLREEHPISARGGATPTNRQATEETRTLELSAARARPHPCAQKFQRRQALRVGSRTEFRIHETGAGAHCMHLASRRKRPVVPPP